MKVSIKNILPDYELENKRVILGESYKVVVNPDAESDLRVYLELSAKC